MGTSKREKMTSGKGGAGALLNTMLKARGERGRQLCAHFLPPAKAAPASGLCPGAKR